MRTGAYYIFGINNRRDEKHFYKFPRSWGDSGALYLQSATAGVMIGLGLFFVVLPIVSDVDAWVLRDRNL